MRAGTAATSNESHATTPTATPAADESVGDRQELHGNRPVVDRSHDGHTQRVLRVSRHEHGGESATRINSTLVTTLSYADTTAASGTTYYYTVKAVYGVGNSAASNESFATTAAVSGDAIAINAGGGVSGSFRRC